MPPRPPPRATSPPRWRRCGPGPRSSPPARPARPGAGLASGGDGPHDVWALTARVAPELTEWAQRFAAATGQRVGVETGLVRVTAREADDLLRDAETFVDLAAGRLGVPSVHRPRRLVPVRSA